MKEPSRNLFNLGKASPYFEVQFQVPNEIILLVVLDERLFFFFFFFFGTPNCTYTVRACACIFYILLD